MGFFTKKECDVLKIPLGPSEQAAEFNQGMPLFKRQVYPDVYLFNAIPENFYNTEVAAFMGFPARQNEEPIAYYFEKDGSLKRLYDRRDHPYSFNPSYENYKDLPIGLLTKREASYIEEAVEANEQPQGFVKTRKGHLVAVYARDSYFQSLDIITEKKKPVGYFSKYEAADMKCPLDEGEEPVFITFFMTSRGRKFKKIYNRTNDPRWRLKLLFQAFYDPLRDRSLKASK